MQSVNLTCHTDRSEIALKGVLGVGDVRDAYGVLDEALTRALPLDLQTAELERADAAAMQLLLRFVMTARERGLRLQWGSVGSAFKANAELLGLAAELELPR